MAHHIYQTEGIVLWSSPEGESNKYLRIFTRELGLVGGTARSIRENKSKLRYGLQDYSVSSIALVRGKEVWRIINSVPHLNYYSLFKEHKTKLAACIRVVSLVRKLVVGEGKHTHVYDELIQGLEFLRNQELSRENIIHFQLIAALRILELLGYGVQSQTLRKFIEGKWDMSLVLDFKPHAQIARGEIRRALSASHL